MDKMVLKTAQTVFIPREAEDMRQVRRVKVKPVVEALKSPCPDVTTVEGTLEVAISYYPALPGDCGPFTETVKVPLVAEVDAAMPCGQGEVGALEVLDVEWESISSRAIELTVTMKLYCVPQEVAAMPDFHCRREERRHHEECDISGLLQSVDPVLPLADHIAAAEAARAQAQAQAKAEQAAKEAEEQAAAAAKAAEEKMRAEAEAQAKAAAEKAQAEAEARMKAQAEEAARVAKAAMEAERAAQAAKAAEEAAAAAKAEAEALAAEEAAKARAEAANAQAQAEAAAREAAKQEEDTCQAQQAEVEEPAEILLAPAPEVKVAVCAGLKPNPGQRIAAISAGKGGEKGGRYCLTFQMGKKEVEQTEEVAELDAMDACYYEE